MKITGVKIAWVLSYKYPLEINKIQALRDFKASQLFNKYLNQMSTYHLACGDSEITQVG